jgi:hypothetical protein
MYTEENYNKLVAALQRIARQEGICVDYEYDSHPTEKELATYVLKEVGEPV